MGGEPETGLRHSPIFTHVTDLPAIFNLPCVVKDADRLSVAELFAPAQGFLYNKHLANPLGTPAKNVPCEPVR